MILTRTPVRISFFGGGTDYPEWFLNNGGAVLGATIDKYCYVSLHSSGQSAHFFDVPTRSGLATSSAFTVGLLRASCNLEQIVLARMAVDWERDKSGGNVGYQDQYLCALGGMLNLHFSDQGVDVIPIEHNDLADNLMLFYTGIRSMGSYRVIEEQLSNIKERSSELHDIHALVNEGIKNIRNVEFGKLLGTEWALKKRLGKHITTPEIDAMYDTAIQNGAIGGKLLGAGNGGFLLLYAMPETQQKVTVALGLKRVPFKFSTGGTEIICSTK
jgi:D-glycero-alpha-D-manno-heptose-7-phosphate kinase